MMERAVASPAPRAVVLHAGAREPILALLSSVGPNYRTLQDGELACLVVESAPRLAREAEAELCRRFGPRVRSFGLRHLRSEHAAADLVQRVLLLVLEKLRAGAVREPERIGSFLLGAARRVAWEMQRGLEQVGAPVEETELRAVETAPMRLPGHRLAAGFELLRQRERAVLLLSFYHDQSAREIAEALGMTEGNVRVVRHRAIEQLRGHLGLDREDLA